MLVALMAALVVTAQPSIPDDTLRVLFIGNSHTYVNNVPGMVESLAVAGGRLLATDLSAPGGYALMQHCTTEATLSRIQQATWDVVVLQEQSQIPVIDYWRFNGMYPASRLLDSLIRENRGATMFYMTWGWKNGGQHSYSGYSSIVFRDYFHMQDSVAASYEMIAGELGARMAPVGRAWRLAKSLDTLIQLHQPDECHATLQGSYLGACVFYAVLFGADPTGLTYRAGLDSTQAVFLQNAAWQTVSGLSEASSTDPTRPATLTIAPDPCRGRAAVKTPLAFRSSPLVLSVYDTDGRLVISSSVDIRASSFPLNLSSIRPGVYFVYLSSSAGSASGRLTVSR